MKYYLVVYLMTYRKKGDPILANAIINKHPLVWAANPPPVYDNHFITKILSWQEIPSEIAHNEDVIGYFGQEFDQYDAILEMEEK